MCGGLSYPQDYVDGFIHHGWSGSKVGRSALFLTGHAYGAIYAVYVDSESMAATVKRIFNLAVARHCFGSLRPSKRYSVWSSKTMTSL
jgi:hypothetical protein